MREWISNNIEIVPLTMNFLLMAFYLFSWISPSRIDEPGKILYWLGATILTAGILLMKG